MLRGSRTGKSGGERTKGGISRALPVGGVIRPKGAVRRRVGYLCTDGSMIDILTAVNYTLALCSMSHVSPL